jgi:hypothetical protein
VRRRHETESDLQEMQGWEEKMSRTGLTRKIGGHVYHLYGQYVGRGAREHAYGSAKFLRNAYQVRVIKVMPGYYRVYRRSK